MYVLLTSLVLRTMFDNFDSPVVLQVAVFTRNSWHLEKVHLKAKTNATIVSVMWRKRKSID